MNRNEKLLKMVLAALFLALAFVMPFFTGQIPEIGQMLCPLHIPVLLCGFICGWKWGLQVGLIAPLLRSLTLGMPPLFPTAIAMSFESVFAVIGGAIILHQQPLLNESIGCIFMFLAIILSQIPISLNKKVLSK